MPDFIGFPKYKYHPVDGKVEVKDPNEEAALFPPHDYFDTPGEADMHRTDREAQMVIHQNRRVKLDDRDEPPVRNSVQAQESVDAGNFEPL